MSQKILQKNALEQARDWWQKILYLENQVDSLEKIKGIPTISISVFLLKTQYVEFQLKQLITSIDQHIFFSNFSSVIKPQVRTPRQLEDSNIRMLGQILNELKKYKGESLKNLISYLGELNKNKELSLPINFMSLRGQF